MDPSSTIQAFDLGCRGAAVALTLLVAGLLIREHGRVWAARLGAAFAIGVASYSPFAPNRESRLTSTHGRRRSLPCAPATARSSGLPGPCSTMASSPAGGMPAVWGALAGLGLLEFFVLVPARSPLAVPVGVALSLASLGFAILAVVQTISGWRTDLIEGRRRLRAPVVIGAAGYIAIVGAAELLLRGRPPPLTATALNAAGLAAASALIAWSLLRVAGKDLFPEPHADSDEAAVRWAKSARSCGGRSRPGRA